MDRQGRQVKGLGDIGSMFWMSQRGGERSEDGGVGNIIYNLGVDRRRLQLSQRQGKNISLFGHNAVVSSFIAHSMQRKEQEKTQKLMLTG
jgi:hypothetical protein